MSWRDILVKMHHLHKVRRSISHSSIYHQRYVDECIKLNEELVKLTGRNFIDYTIEEVDNAEIETIIGLEEDI
jgi:hypothetical protein